MVASFELSGHGIPLRGSCTDDEDDVFEDEVFDDGSTQYGGRTSRHSRILPFGDTRSRIADSRKDDDNRRSATLQRSQRTDNSRSIKDAVHAAAMERTATTNPSTKPRADTRDTAGSILGFLSPPPQKDQQARERDELERKKRHQFSREIRKAATIAKLPFTCNFKNINISPENSSARMEQARNADNTNSRRSPDLFLTENTDHRRSPDFLLASDVPQSKQVLVDRNSRTSSHKPHRKRSQSADRAPRGFTEAVNPWSRQLDWDRPASDVFPTAALPRNYGAARNYRTTQRNTECIEDICEGLREARRFIKKANKERDHALQEKEKYDAMARFRENNPYHFAPSRLEPLVRASSMFQHIPSRTIQQRPTAASLIHGQDDGHVASTRFASRGPVTQSTRFREAAESQSGSDTRGRMTRRTSSPEPARKPDGAKLRAVPSVSSTRPVVTWSRPAARRSSPSRPKSPFISAGKHKNQRVTFSVPANNQELLSHFKQNYPHLKTLAENVLRDSRDSDTLVEDMLGALEKRAGLLKRTLRTLGASLKTDINRRKKISADIDVKQRQYADCCHKIEEIEKAIAEDEPLTPDGRPARVHLGNRINQIRLLQKIFGH